MLRSEVVYQNFPYAELKATDGSARIRIYTYAYQFPNTNTGDDADWYMNYISLSINGINSEINEPLIQGHTFKCLLGEVEQFRDLLIREADFSFIERDFGFTLKKIGLKSEVIVQGEMLDVKLDESEAHIHFKFITDMNKIDIFIKGMKTILGKFPSRY